MFIFDYTKIFNMFSRHKENTDIIIRTWKSENEKEYDDFKKRIDKIFDNDLSILLDMYKLMKECVPPEAQSFYDWLLNLLTQKLGRTRNLLKKEKHWAGKYTEKIEKCIKNKQLLLGINLKTGEVDIYTSCQKNLLMVRSGTPSETWDRLPLYMKSYIIDQANKLLEQSKKHLYFSRLKRKKTAEALAFFANIFYLSHAVFMPGFMANLYDKTIERQESLLYCMYYFVVFDHGLQTMFKILNDIISKDDIDGENLVFVRNCVHMLVHESLQLDVENKGTWTNAVNDCNPELWKEVMCALSKAKGKRGKKKTIYLLDDLLKGNVESLKKLIEEFIERYVDVGEKNFEYLACLLFALIKAEKIKKNIEYMTFHRAIEAFKKCNYGHDTPQELYGILKKEPKEGLKENKYKKVQRVIEEWSSIFKEVK